MGYVYQSQNTSLSENRSSYSGVNSVSEPIMSEAVMS